jgi:hypothetical protein
MRHANDASHGFLRGNQARKHNEIDSRRQKRGTTQWKFDDYDFSSLATSSTQGIRLIHGRYLYLSIAILYPSIQIHLLQHRAESLRALRIAFILAVMLHCGVLQVLTCTTRILNVEDWLSGVDESVECVAFDIGDALFVDGEVYDW